MDRLLDSATLNFIAKSLDCHAVNHQMIANNMANINTPGYKGTEVAFKDQLITVLHGEHSQLPLKINRPRHIPFGIPMSLDDVKPRLIVDPSTSMRTDGNNVDIDSQMAQMAENSMRINALTRLASDKLRGLRTVIEGR